MGITGLLGSGRTELAKAIYGLMPADSGSIYINGKEVKIDSAMKGLEYHIAYVPEDRLTEALFMDQSITRNVIIQTMKKVSRTGLYNSKKALEEAKNWIQQLNIKTANPKNKVSTLSGGNQQKVVLAKALMTDPQIIILNCPTVGVDIGSKMDISMLIQEIAEKGVAVILISDDSNEILTNCKRFLLIKNGEIENEYLSKDYTESTLYSKLIR